MPVLLAQKRFQEFRLSVSVCWLSPQTTHPVGKTCRVIGFSSTIALYVIFSCNGSTTTDDNSKASGKD